MSHTSKCPRCGENLVWKNEESAPASCSCGCVLATQACPACGKNFFVDASEYRRLLCSCGHELNKPRPVQSDHDGLISLVLAVAPSLAAVLVIYGGALSQFTLILWGVASVVCCFYTGFRIGRHFSRDDAVAGGLGFFFGIGLVVLNAVISLFAGCASLK